MNAGDVVNQNLTIFLMVGSVQMFWIMSCFSNLSPKNQMIRDHIVHQYLQCEKSCLALILGLEFIKSIFM